MRRYFQRLENCHHRPVYRWLAKLGIDPTRHGWAGWLHTERADIRPVFRDRALAKVMKRSARRAIREVAPPVTRLWWLLQGKADPNDWRLVRQNAVGIGYLPLTTRDHARTGSRERVLDVARRHPDRLRLELDALATRVLLDAGEPGGRRGVPLRGAALPGAPAAQRRAGRAAGDPRVEGGHPGRRGLQHAAAPDAVRDRAARGAGAPRHRGPGGAPRRGPEPPGPLRDRRGEPDGLRALEGARGGPVRARRSAAPRVGEPATRACTRATARCSG